MAARVARKIKVDTKLTGDISHYSVVVETLKFGWNPLLPIGDRLPYDLVLEINDKFCRIQVKTAWFSPKVDRWLVETRRTKTNRRRMKREYYKASDFEFAIAYSSELNVFWVFPSDFFCSFRGAITLGNSNK